MIVTDAERDEVRGCLEREYAGVLRLKDLPRRSWLWPLSHPIWKGVMKTHVGGRMLDEWVSSLPLLREFALRHLIVCRRVAQRPA